MKSQKQLGNQCYKSRQYQQAIQHYQTYIKDQHTDNKNALANLSLCYSKLNQPKLSIQAALDALDIDQTFAKCYYRLAHQYKHLPNQQYNVFINAIRYLRYASPDQKSSKEQMYQIARNYRKKLGGNNQRQKGEHIKDIIAISQQFVEERQIREQIDRQTQEWIFQWEKNQDQQAKWLQIEYIIEDIDYQYGINLAQFHINRLKSSQAKKDTRLKLKELKQRIKRQQSLDFKQLGIDTSQVPLKQEDEESSDDNLFEEQKKRAILKNEKENRQKKVQSNKQEQLKKVKKQDPKTLLELKQKRQQLMEEKEEYSDQDQDIYQQIKPVIPKTQKQTKQVKETKQKKETTKQSKQVKVQTKSQKKEGRPTEKTAQKQKQKTEIKESPSKSALEVTKNTSEGKDEQILKLYDSYCGELAKSKDIFTATYASVLKILESKKISPSTKGQLLVQMRKKVKKFKLIMQACSQNQQKIVFNLLKENKLEEYAIDLAPKHYDM